VLARVHLPARTFVATLGAGGRGIRGPQVRGEAHVATAAATDQHLDVRQIHRVRPDMAQQAARGRHQHVDAAAQAPGRGIEAHAAEHHGVTQRQEAAVGSHALAHLGGQLAGGREDQGTRMVPLPGAIGEPLKQRQREGRGHARASLGASDRPELAAVIADGQAIR
jgi:hypothetical protein